MSQTGDGNGKRLEIRKYPNRRYYDSTRSRHVTLEEIHQLIREGYEVRVTDSKTEKDITARVLAQIIIELDTPKLGVFPVPMLHRLLRSNEQFVQDFVTRYFSQPLMSYLESQRNMEQYLRQMMGMPSQTPTVADWAKLMFGAMPPMWGAANGHAEPRREGAAGTPHPKEPGPSPTAGAPTAGAWPPPTPPTPGAAAGASGSAAYGGAVEDLRQVVSDLRSQLSALRAEMETKGGRRPRRGTGRRGKPKGRP